MGHSADLLQSGCSCQQPAEFAQVREFTYDTTGNCNQAVFIIQFVSLYFSLFCALSRTFASHKLRLRDEIMVLSVLQANNAAAPRSRLDLLDDTDAHDHTAAIQKLEECLVALDDCKDVIATYTELKPFSVFGFKIESSTVFTVFSTGLSFFGVLFSLYSNASSGVAASS